MAISKDALKSIQKTGAFAHKAKLALQETTKKYSERLSKALTANPYDFGDVNPKDLETGKEMRALAQRIHSVEVELRDIFATATALSKGELKKVLAKAEVAVATAVDKLVPAKKAKPVVKSAAHKSVKGKPRAGGNKEKLFAALQKTLKSDGYSRLNQSELSKKTGVPLGSMTAAIRSLIQAGSIVAGPSGEYKLGKAEAAVAAVKAATPAKRAAVAKKTKVAKARVGTAPKNAEVAAAAGAVAKVVKKVSAKKSVPPKSEGAVKAKAKPTTEVSVVVAEPVVTAPGI